MLRSIAATCESSSSLDVRCPYRRAAGILTDVLGRSIRYARPSEAEYLHRLREQHLPEDYIAVQKMIYRVVRLNISAFPNRAVRRLTGRPATTFREFAERERAAWGSR